jgi:hypothetical protein
MNEVELMSEFMMLLTHGALGTSVRAMGQTYGKYEDAFPAAPEVARRIRRVFDEIDGRISAKDMKENFSRRTLFYGLFATFYGLMFGLTKPTPIVKPSPKLIARLKPTEIPKKIVEQIVDAGNNIREGKVPERLAKGLRGATKDPVRRRALIKYLAGPDNDPCKGIL